MRSTLLNQAITAAVGSLTASPLGQIQLNDAPRSLVAQAVFTAGSGGSSVDAYLQTSLDNGATWVDIAQFHFTNANAAVAVNLSSLTSVTTQYTETNGSLSANTCKDGILGPLFQVQYKSSGTYVGANLKVDVVAQER